MDDRFEEKICHADSETWDWKILIEFGEWQCKLAVTIDVARQGLYKRHLAEKVQLRAKECEDHKKAILWEG